MNTDKGGIPDGVPKEYKKNSKKNYISRTAFGKFDGIVSIINEDGSCTQKLYDFINEKRSVIYNHRQYQEGK